MKKNLSKKSLAALVFFLATLALARTVNAQATVVTFTPGAEINSDLDVDDVGTNVFAFSGNSATDTVNGITFDGNSLTQGSISMTTTFTNDFGSNTYENKSAAADGLSAGLYNVLGGGLLSIGGTETQDTVTLSGLTSGDTYQVELFVYDDRQPDGSSDAGRAESVTAPGDTVDSSELLFGGTDPGVFNPNGEFTIATFVANGTSQTLDLNAGGEVGFAATTQLNALVLNDEGVVISVPEPSAYLMVGLGLVGLVVLRRARGSKLA